MPVVDAIPANRARMSNLYADGCGRQPLRSGSWHSMSMVALPSRGLLLRLHSRHAFKHSAPFGSDG